MIKPLKKIDSSDFFSEYLHLEKRIIWTEFGHKGKQTGLQYRLGEDPWTSAVGKGRGNEFEINELNPFFKNTIFESLILEYNLVRTRLMWSGPFSCYSMHQDDNPRIHIPIVTNHECYFLFKDLPPQHMPLDYLYWVDTRKSHTFINCSDYQRLHLVGIVKN